MEAGPLLLSHGLQGLADIMLRGRRVADEERRDLLVIREILRQILLGLKELHSIGIVHRDVK